MKQYLVREMEIKYKASEWVKKTMNTPEAVYEFMKDKIGDATQENFAVLCVNTKNVITGWQIISRGSATEAVVHPREVFKLAILSNANAIIVCHNHPSGEPAPSREDIVTTMRLKNAGELLGLPILDHIIIGDGKFYSMREHGHL
jgi:DNA repair protein RadC